MQGSGRPDSHGPPMPAPGVQTCLCWRQGAGAGCKVGKGPVFGTVRGERFAEGLVSGTWVKNLF